MENYSVVIFIMAIMICLSAIADKIKLPYPVLLIVAGIGIGCIPGLPQIQIDPEVIFLIFLPPLLYDAAFTIDAKQFKTNFHTINTLAVSLVFISATGIAVTAYYLLPFMTWPLAFVLGAILSATDAVAAISVTKGLGLSHKTSTILEGESLINDASALVCYSFALAAVGGAAFIFWQAALKFVMLIGGGILLGMIVSRILAFVLTRIHNNSLVTISFMLLMPFVTYLLGEHLHVSGVIAVVVMGLGIARFSNHLFPEALKKQSRDIWNINIFLLNGLIFILIGLEFPYVVKMIDRSQLWRYVGYSLVITVVALALRMARVFLQQVNLQKQFKTGRGRRKVDENSLLDFKTSLIISWSGMRGIVSLAMALALPVTLSDDTVFPQRNDILFVTVAVVLFTIIGQGTTLPWLVKKLLKSEVKNDGSTS